MFPIEIDKEQTLLFFIMYNKTNYLTIDIENEYCSNVKDAIIHSATSFAKVLGIVDEDRVKEFVAWIAGEYMSYIVHETDRVNNELRNL